MKLPEKFIERIRERAGVELSAFLKSYELPPAQGLKVNTLKISSDEFCARFGALERVPWARDAFYHTEEKAGGSLPHFAGLFYLQEPSAMCAAPLLGVEPGDKVLDLCAAPGGKSVQIACDLQGEGILISNEIDFARAKILSQNLERMGVRNCAVTSAEPTRLCEEFPAYFDKILVDAPCSGEGMFKKEKNAIAEWSEGNVLFCARRQEEILDEAAKMLACGGKLVYSTCTFAEEEDEWQAEEFLKKHPEFTLIKSIKLYPHEVRGEGHFAALFEKTAGERGTSKPYPIRKNAAANCAFEAFCEDFLEGIPNGEITTLEDGRMYLVPREFPALSHVRILRLGLELGEWDAKVFRPAHALSVAANLSFQKKIFLDKEEAERYLRGETLCKDIDGWCILAYEDFPLGLGKGVSGLVKNHYPKGLRLYR